MTRPYKPTVRDIDEPEVPEVECACQAGIPGECCERLARLLGQRAKASKAYRDRQPKKPREASEP